MERRDQDNSGNFLLPKCQQSMNSTIFQWPWWIPSPFPQGKNIWCLMSSCASDSFFNVLLPATVPVYLYLFTRSMKTNILKHLWDRVRQIIHWIHFVRLSQIIRSFHWPKPKPAVYLLYSDFISPPYYCQSKSGLIMKARKRIRFLAQISMKDPKPTRVPDFLQEWRCL